MIGPVSSTGRAMMASLQQAIQKGMPPDQAIQYVKSMATQGVAPLTDLYAMMNQFQRLKQQQVQAPQTPPTIRDQLNMAEMQQRQQQMAMQQGLGGMPAPVMDNAQFAGGGIVAFAGGGLTAEEEAEFEKLAGLMKSASGYGAKFAGAPWSSGYQLPSEAVSGLSAQLKARFDALKNKKEAAEQAEIQAERQAAIEEEGRARGLIPPSTPAPAQTTTRYARLAPRGGPVNVAPPTPPAPLSRRPATGASVPAAPSVAAEAPTEKKMTLEDFMAPLREAGKPLREATEEYRRYLASEEASAKEQSGRDRMLALAQAGFGMAQAASKPGATFLGSVGAAGGDYAKAMMQLNREAAAAKRGIVKERLALAQAEASGNKEDYITAYRGLTENEKKLTDAYRYSQELGLKREELGLKRASLAIEQSLGLARINAELTNAAATLGLRTEEARARAANQLQELRVKVAELGNKGVERLVTTEEYINASPEQKPVLEQAEYNKAAALVYGSGAASGAGAGSSGQWGQVSVKP